MGINTSNPAKLGSKYPTLAGFALMKVAKLGSKYPTLASFITEVTLNELFVPLRY